MNQSKEIYFTNDSDIIAAFQELPSGPFDERTLNHWIDYFKQCMYYTSSAFYNYSAFSLAYDSIKTSEQYPQEFLFIHSLMYHFLCSDNNVTLQFSPYKTIDDHDKLTVFKWNIPSHTMPFLISYIKATNKFKKNEPIISFFEELSETLTDATKHQNTSTQKEYLALIQNVLCKNFFLTLDEIYKIFAKNTEQQKIIRNALSHLMQTLLILPINNYHAKENVYLLLTSFKEKLYSHTNSSHNKKRNLSSLYHHFEPFPVSKEYYKIQEAKNTLLYFPQKLFSFLEENLDLNTTYHIAAKDYKTFSNKCTAILNELNQEVSKCQEEISSFYQSIEFYPTLKQAYENGQLKLNKKNLNKRSTLVIDALSSYFMAISKETNSFKNKVKKASSSCPQNYITLNTEHDYLKNFQDSITAIQKKLYNEKFMNTLNNYKAFLFFNTPGLITKLTYPNIVSKKESLRLICELTGTMYPLSEDYVIQQFFNRGQFYPMFLFVFLSKCNDVIIDLNLS